MDMCRSIGCTNPTHGDKDFCLECSNDWEFNPPFKLASGHEPSMAEKYPKYYKSVAHLTEIDPYAVHHLFGVSDPSGAIQHASKKLLLSGVRTGGKSAYQDIKEARDALNRWLQLNEDPSNPIQR